ncbi:hypothetical protein CKA32_005749 [Geitlerinema sp. FC II]|nr:hypothetical protein CKA32_005749 [Geitlerinema sp. FC II]
MYGMLQNYLNCQIETRAIACKSRPAGNLSDDRCHINPS